MRYGPDNNGRIFAALVAAGWTANGILWKCKAEALRNRERIVS
jgi:hypothetical protein